MIKQIQRLHLDVGGPPAVELVVRGATARLLPILTTALATGLALLPLLVVGDSAGHEIVRPMAIVMIGGLVCAVLVNLLVVPALYLKLGGRRADELDFGATATLEEAASPTR